MTTSQSSEEVGFKLAQNKPNPFKEVTEFGFQLPVASDVSLQIIDIQGKLVFHKIAAFNKGSHTIYFNQDLSEGTYFYQLSSSSGVATKKMIVVK